jgi:hypothetical protein
VTRFDVTPTYRVVAATGKKIHTRLLHAGPTTGCRRLPRTPDPGSAGMTTSSTHANSGRTSFFIFASGRSVCDALVEYSEAAGAVNRESAGWHKALAAVDRAGDGPYSGGVVTT